MRHSPSFGTLFTERWNGILITPLKIIDWSRSSTSQELPLSHKSWKAWSQIRRPWWNDRSTISVISLQLLTFIDHLDSLAILHCLDTSFMQVPYIDRHLTLADIAKFCSQKHGLWQGPRMLSCLWVLQAHSSGYKEASCQRGCGW